MDNRIDAIYGRQSIDKKDSISIESQFEFCRYELKGGEGKEYKDKGYSGKNIERPDFQRLLQDIRLGLIKRVIVYKLDRISRSIVDFAKLMELFKQYDVEFVSCTEKFDTSTPMGRAMLNICIVFAQLERESIQMRVQDAFYSRCTKGYYMRGRTPYGFDKKMRKFHTLKGGKEQSYNPKLTAARVALAKTESEIEKLLDTLSGANPLLLQYANNRIEELDAERQKQLRLVADLTANSVSASQIDSITGYLDDWESVSFDDKRKVVDILISQIDATSESVTIHWKI